MEHNEQLDERWSRLWEAVSNVVCRKRRQGYRFTWSLEPAKSNRAGYVAVFNGDGSCLASVAVWISLDGRGYQFRLGGVGRLAESESPARVAGYLLRRLNRNLKLRGLA